MDCLFCCKASWVFVTVRPLPCLESFIEEETWLSSVIKKYLNHYLQSQLLNLTFSFSCLLTCQPLMSVTFQVAQYAYAKLPVRSSMHDRHGNSVLESFPDLKERISTRRLPLSWKVISPSPRKMRDVLIPLHRLERVFRQCSERHEC